MGMFDWLFGKRTTTVADRADRQPAAAGERDRGPAAEQPAAAWSQANGQAAAAGALPSEADNLRRWREAGHARAWVEAQDGQWDHAAWLTLLDDLKRSAYWPMPPDGIGQALEEAKREWLRRN